MTLAPNKVFLNARFLTQPMSGMQRYAEELTTALDDLIGDRPDTVPFTVEALVPPGPTRPVPWRHIPVRQVGRLRGHAWEQWDLWRASAEGVLVSPCSVGPLLHPRHVVVMHDAAIFAHPEHFSWRYRTWHRWIRPRLAARAAGLATISEFSRRELSRYCGVAPERFTIIPDSAEHILRVPADDTILQRHGLRRGRYALTVGNQSPNKNIALAVRAFGLAQLPDMELVVAGGGASKIFGARGVPEEPGVKCVGRVSDGELRALYENAAVFLFPSRYEGFGVPPLEAMALGCPVISSDATAMPEVLGDAASYFSSDNAKAFSESISELAASKWLCSGLTDAGIARAAKYCWSESAIRLISIASRTPANPNVVQELEHNPSIR